MSENPTARFAPSATCYELYENFQIELQELKKQISTKESSDQQGDVEAQKNIEIVAISAGQKRLQDLVLGKIDLVSDIMENMFTKLTNLMNDASKDKDVYSLQQKIEEQNEIIFQLKEEGVQIRAQLGQQKTSHKLKKQQLKNQISQQNSDLNDQRQLFQNFKDEISHIVETEKNKARRLEKWFVRLLEKIELDLVEQQNNKLSGVVEKVRNSRKNKPWKHIMGETLNGTTQQNNFLTGKVGSKQSNNYNSKKEEQNLFQSAAISNHINDIGVMYSDFDEEDFSQMTCNNNPSTDQKPQSIDKSINQAFIFSDDRSSNASNQIVKNNEIIPNRLPFTPQESDQFNEGAQSKQNGPNPFEFQSNNFNILNLGELNSEKVNKFLRQNKLDLSVSQLEQEVLNLFQKTDRSTTNAHLNLKDVQLEDILNVTQQNNSISLELDFNREFKMNNTNKQVNNNNSLEKLLNSFSTSLSKKMSQKMKIKDLKENFPQELSPISSAQGKSQNNSINLHFSGVEQQNGFKNNMMNSSIINSASNILPLNNNNISNINSSNNLNNNLSIQSNSNLMLSFIKGNKQENRKYNNNTMSNNTDLFILKEIADSESKEDCDKDILQILSASVNNFNTTKNIQEFEKKMLQNNLAALATPILPQSNQQNNTTTNNINNHPTNTITNTPNNNNLSQIQPKCTYESLQCILQNIKIEDQQENFLESSQDFSKDEKLDQAIFECDNSANLKKDLSNQNDNSTSANNNIFNSSFMNSPLPVDQTYQQDKKSQDSCSLLADLQFDQKQSSKLSHTTSNNNNDSKNIKKNFHKKSISQNIPKLDLSGISVQNNNNTTNNFQANNNSNNSFFFTNQMSDSPIQTEKNQTTKNLRYEEEQTERKNNKVQQQESIIQESKQSKNDQSDLINQSKINNHKNKLLLQESPSSFNSKSDYKEEGNNSFLTQNQPFDLQQIKKIQIDDFAEISQQELSNVTKQKTPKTNQQTWIQKPIIEDKQISPSQTFFQNQINKSTNENAIDLSDNLKRKSNKLNNNKPDTSNLVMNFYDDEIKNDQRKPKHNQEQQSLNVEVKMKQNPSKHGLFIDSFNELFNTNNNIHISNESPKVVFDTFNNSLAPNHDDYSNIKQELINYSSIEETNQCEALELNSHQLQCDKKNQLKDSKKNLFKTEYQQQKDISNYIIQPINQYSDTNKKDHTQLSNYICHLTNLPINQNKQQNLPQQSLNNIIVSSTPKNTNHSAVNSSLGDKSQSKQENQLDNKQLHDLIIQKNTQVLFSRKRVISDHDKVKKDFEQVLNENIQKEKNLEVLTNIQQNYNSFKQRINANTNISNAQQQNHHSAQQNQIKYQNENITQDNNLKINNFIEYQDQISIHNDQISMKFNNNQTNTLQSKKISKQEDRLEKQKDVHQLYDNTEEFSKVHSLEQRKRATTNDDGNLMNKRENEDNRLKKQVANFTQKKMVENELKYQKVVKQEDKVDHYEQLEEQNPKYSTKISNRNENMQQNVGEYLREQNHAYGYRNQNQEGSPLIQDLKKKQNDFYVPATYYLQKQSKIQQIRQQGINKSMEYCSNNAAALNYLPKENLTPSNNSNNYYVSMNTQSSRLEQNKNINSKLLSNSFQMNKIKSNNMSITNPPFNYNQFQDINQNQFIYPNEPFDKDEEIYRISNKQDQLQQKQPLFNRSKQQNIPSYLEVRINPNNVSHDLNNSQDAIKKNILTSGKEKKLPMRATHLNQPIMDISAANNPPEIQSIKFQPLSTPNVPSNKLNNFGKQPKIAVLKQGDPKNDLKQQHLRSAISPKNSSSYHNKENLTNMNNQVDKMLNDQSYIDYSINLQGISPSQIKSKLSSNSPKKKNSQIVHEKQNAPQNILSECTYQVQNNILQNKLIVKRPSQQMNNGNTNGIIQQKQQQQQLLQHQQQQQQQNNNNQAMKHPTRNRNFSTTNATSLINQQMNYAKIQQNYRTLNNQSYEEYEKLMQFEGKFIQPKNTKTNNQ